jgi:fibronectin-binding autotransporter adhesin
LPSIILNGGALDDAAVQFNTVGNITFNSGATLSVGGGYSGAFNGLQLLGTVSVGGTSGSTISTGASSGNLYLLGGGITFFNVAATGGTGADLAISSVVADGGGHQPGSAALTKTGAGVMMLNAANTYSGATTINQGTLQIGDGGYSGSLSASSAIVDNAVLAFDRSDALAVTNVISGSGSVSQIGPGTTTLSGSNGYSGGTSITSGVLQLGNTAALGTGGLAANGGTLDLEGNSILVPSFSGAAGAVTDYGFNFGTTTLTVNQSLATTFGGTIADGPWNLLSLSLSGGTLTLSGTNSYTGGTTVADGTLILTSAEAISDGTSLTVGNALAFPAAPVPCAVAGLPTEPQSLSAAITPVPEPGTLILLVAGAAMLAMYRKRRRE